MCELFISYIGMSLMLSHSSVFITSASFSIHRVEANLLIILLQGSQILSGLRELTLLHALSNIPTQREK